ncbi:MAG: polysaccharide biosynthesis C-terminal domain-containing protein [Dermatophilaceae bacterium]
MPDTSVPVPAPAQDETSDSSQRDTHDPQHHSGIGRVLAKGTSWQTAPQVLAWVINIGMTPYVISGLGPGRYSIFLLINTLTMMLSTFDGGLGPSAQRYYALYAGRDDRASTTRLLVTVSAVLGVVCSVIFAALLLAAPWVLTLFRVDPRFQPESLFLLRTLTVIVYFVFLRNLFNSILFARQQFRTTAIASFVSYGVYAAGLTLTVERGWGLRGVAYTFIAQQVMASVFTVPAALGYLDRHAVRWMPRADLVEFLRYAWKVQIASFITLFTAQKDQLVAAYLLSAQMSGPYGQGASFAEQLRLLPYNAISPMQSLIGSTVGRDGPDAALATVARVQRLWVRGITGWFAVGIPACFFGLRAWLPASFEISGTVGAVLLAGLFFTMAAAVLLLWALTLGHPELDVRYGVVGLVINGVLSLILAPTIGVIGVVIATAISRTASVFFLAWDARRTLQCVPPWFTRDIPLLPAIGACAITGLVELGVQGVMPHGPLGLIFSGVLALPGLLFYVQVVFGLRTLSRAAGRSGLS